jgi:hypothetical protein
MSRSLAVDASVPPCQTIRTSVDRAPQIVKKNENPTPKSRAEQYWDDLDYFYSG